MQPARSRIHGFKNLTSLELCSLSGEPDDLTQDISNLLLESPNLKKLGLSLACEWESRPPPMAVIRLDFEGLEFLKHVSRAYSSVEGARPLSIETLRLGYGVGMKDQGFRTLAIPDASQPLEERLSKFPFLSPFSLW